MSNEAPGAGEAFGKVEQSWDWSVGFGLLALLAGILALVWSGPTVLAIAVIFEIQLLAGITPSSFHVVTDNYIFSHDLTSWGRVHLVSGLLVGLSGIALAMGQPWARIAGISLVGTSAPGDFPFIPYQPMWSLLLIAIDVVVVRA